MIHHYDFDLFVIGGGSGGVRAARMAGQRGARVALAECAELGGTCVNVGCVPKKLYSYAAGYAAAFEEAPGYGWTLPEAPRFDWATLKRQRAQEITRLNGVYQKLLDGAGVKTLTGWAQLVDGHTVSVSDTRYTARHILVATGGMPAAPDMPGRELAVVSDAMFDLPDFPKRLLVMGGGYIGCEFASLFRGLGAHVTLVNRGAHILNGLDDDVREALAREMGRQGIDLRMTAQVETLRREGDGLVAMLSRGQQIEADTVLLATGRKPNTAGMGLDAAGVKLDARGAVVVDAQYRSSVPSVLAIGDVSSRLALTPVALAEAMVVVDQLFGDGQRRMGYDNVPTAVFTHPNVATCGLTEAAARAKFGEKGVRIFAADFKALRHTLSGRDERTFIKLVVDAKSDCVVGLHMVGADAGEIVQGFAVAMNAGATKAQFDSTIGIHPTTAEEFVTLREPMVG